ncbi:hypothetical protein HGB07_10155, partial [Candidatus Roizmanbacteria bacterium]|nr:hypothetical protein [Candidatus Roizmanbacteria bacterium]
MKKDLIYFGGLFTIILFLFQQAFSIHFFQDDYFFLQISNIHSFQGFLNFFSPIRDYSYKPLPTEVFYFFIQHTGNNMIVAHAVVFFTYFIGLIFLYKSLLTVTKNEVLSRTATFLYAVSFVHVFQLYWLATYQEILMFTFLSAAFYFYVKRALLPSIILFILSLFCKETAILFSLFLVFYEVFLHKKREIKKLIPYLIISMLFYLIYRYSLQFVTNNDNYKIELSNIRLMINNTLWYSLWSIGFPNFMSDYFRSIFSAPIPEFWKVINNPTILIYLKLLGATLVVCIGSIIYLLIRNIRSARLLAVHAFISFFSFLIFLGPIL